MLNPLVVAVVVALVAAAVLLLRSRQGEPAKTGLVQGAEPGAQRDYPMEREDARIASMSADDRAWEAASLQRNQDMTRRSGSPDEHA